MCLGVMVMSRVATDVPDSLKDPASNSLTVRAPRPAIFGQSFAGTMA